MEPNILDQIVTGLGRFWRQEVVDRYHLWRARIHGIEVTQAIQYYRAAEHLTDPADQWPDNSVTLVAYKAAWVRVYVRSGLISAANTVTGTLELARRNYTMGYDLVATYSPQGASTVTALQTIGYATERGALNRTLNFVIPASEFYGTLRLTARLQGVTGSETEIEVRPRLIQTLRVRGIMVAYNGPSSANTPAPGAPPITQLTLAAPTLADLQATAAMSFAAMPVQATGSFAVCATLNWATPLDDPRTGAGGCSANWNTLLNWLELLRDNDGNRADVVYYGLLPTGIPLNVPGCGQDGLGAGAVGDQPTFLHEIGHGYDFAHTPCGPVGTSDPNYPTYEPYASASIGEWGLDIRNGRLFDPATARDYMSYCMPPWMSLYQHDRLIQHPRLAPRWVKERSIFDDYPHQRPFDLEHLWWPDPPWFPDELREYSVNPIISIVGRVHPGGRIEVQSVARILAAGHPQGVTTRWHAQLLDDRGQTLAHAPLVRLRHHGGGDCGCHGADRDPDEPPFSFKAYLADVGPGAVLRIDGPAEQSWSREAPDRPPRFARAEAALAEDRLELSWEVEPEPDVDVWAQWSADRGAHWHGLAVGLRDGQASLPLTGLPAGAVELRLLANDGFFTAYSEPMPLELPERAPVAVILHPSDGATLPPDHPIQVAGNATDTAGNPLPDERLRWSLEGRELGRGRELWLSSLHPGRHRLTLEVEWREGVARESVTFVVEARG